MLQIVTPNVELWDERTESFFEVKSQRLQLEHSLVSISKWESKWNKPFLTNEEKTDEETIDYIRCMTLTQNVKPIVYETLSNDNIVAINNYIGSPMTATIITHQENRSGAREIITSELIYYWMIALNIPIECQKWHFNRLMILIRICNIKNQPPKKMGRNERLRNNAKINAARRKKSGSKG